MDVPDDNAFAMRNWDANLSKRLAEWEQTKTIERWKAFVIACVAYFSSDIFQHSGKHWFCQDETTRVRAVSSLAVLSFEESTNTSKVLEIYQRKLALMLEECPNCAVRYQICSPELMETLIENLKVPCEAVEEFYKKMERSDKNRLTERLNLNQYDFSAMSEALWCSACLASTKFINEHIAERGPFHNENANVEVKKFQANPGFLLFKYVTTPNLRAATLNTIVNSTEEATNYVNAWKLAPRLFQNALIKGLKRNSQAIELADSAWYTTATILRALDMDREISVKIAGICTDEMIRASGAPKFGANFFLYIFLKLKLSSDLPFGQEKLEKIIDYVTKNNKLHYGAPLPKQLSKEMTNTTYRELDGRVVLEWWSLYFATKPSPDKVEKRLLFVLSLEPEAFKSIESYNKATIVAFKATSTLPDILFEPIMSRYEQRFLATYELLPSEPVYFLWKYQQEHEDKWSPLWNNILRDAMFGRRTLLAPEPNLGIIIGLLEGSKTVGLKWQVPTKLIAARTLPGQEPRISPAEDIITLLVDKICDFNEPEIIAPLLTKNKRILRNVLILTVSGNRTLSFSAQEFVKVALNEDSFEGAINGLVTSSPAMMLSVMNSIIADAAPASPTWLAAMPGIIELMLKVLDQVYDVNEGIDTTSDASITKKLQVFWNYSWEMITNVIKQIKEWAIQYPTSFLKPIILNVLEFSKGLLSKFRLIEADLAETQKEETNWGSTLAGPAISSVNNMSALLQLAIPDLLSMAFDIMIEILGLMSSFKVPIPSSLLALLEGLATRRTRSKLSKEDLKILLVAVGLSETETDLVVDQQVTGIVLKSKEPEIHDSTPNNLNSAPKHAINLHGSSQTSQTQQRSIGDFFKTSSGNKLELPPRKVVNNQVLPNAAPQVSALSQIRAQLHENTAKATVPNAVPAKPAFGPIHPARPPGFNQQKPPQALPLNEDEDEDAEGALGALGVKKKREDAHMKLIQAYQASKGEKLTASTLPAIGKIGPSKQLQEEQRLREERAMKARLNTQPTELHRVLLAWDYFSTVPPVKPKRSIPDQCNNVEEYQSIMAPLLYSEAWEGIQRSKEEAAKYPPVVFQLIFGKRVKVDGFTDVYVSVTKDRFAAANLSEGEYLLLGYDKGTADENFTPSPNKPHFLARIKEGTIKNPKNPKKQHVDFQIRLNVDSTALNRLYSGSTVNGISLGVFTTVEREFTALMALPHYSLLNEILKAKPAISNDSREQISSLENVMGLNYSQATAVSRSTRNSGFSLIQGPPGTGKTKTILGIVGSLFSNSSMKASATASKLNMDRKILICAPSNAAVDEIVLRLKSGVTDNNGNHHKLNILRLGRRDVISEQVRDVTLEEIISRNLDDTAETSDSQLRREHTALTMERNEVRDIIKNASPEEILGLNDKLKNLSEKLKEKNHALDAQRERLDQARKQRDVNYRNQQNEILNNAQVICSTLSGSAHAALSSLGITFESVIIDEAAQSIELSSLIPLKYGARRCVLVGDPNQLPPTVLSKEAGILKYEQSLFVRIYNQYKNVPGAISMLDTQFRMHPAISQFPSKEFYSGKLLDGPGLAEKLRRKWHQESRALGPYTFFNIKGAHERYNGHSLRNEAEARAALELVKHIIRNYTDCGSIGVISPYKEQVRLLEQKFVQALGAEVTSYVDFNSIDGFQGQEKDIIIMSCVRANDRKVNHVGFLGDIRRMNVALTRSKTSLWILGHAESLEVNPVWERLISDAAARGHFVDSTHGNIMRAIKSFDKTVGVPGKRSHDTENDLDSQVTFGVKQKTANGDNIKNGSDIEGCFTGHDDINCAAAIGDSSDSDSKKSEEYYNSDSNPQKISRRDNRDFETIRKSPLSYDDSKGGSNSGSSSVNPNHHANSPNSLNSTQNPDRGQIRVQRQQKDVKLPSSRKNMGKKKGASSIFMPSNRNRKKP